jgi:hypothetical protein
MNCNIKCEHLNERSKKCKKYNKNLAWMRFKGKGISLFSIERCDECKNEAREEAEKVLKK